LSIVDLIIIAPLLIGAFYGYKKGLLLEIVALLALVIAVVGGMRLLEWSTFTLKQYITGADQWLPIIAFIIIFILIVLAVNLVGRLVKKVLDLTLFGFIDNLAGMALGVIKWAFVLSLLIWLANTFQVELPQDQIEGSLIYPYIANIAPTTVSWAIDVLPIDDDLVAQLQQLVNPQ